ncbi:hypothetical protein TeGR_g9984 [Tetraparma gracilis]|uniref:Multidrug and toxic compound extrusion protein n=1 Tax=Tetraparma gracilis TaxID=2962635 RepID=A0ABQ6MSL9_9STRA|nr:hypothetical protein TeGR_g9984 [Tetraparma gracilis]
MPPLALPPAALRRSFLSISLPALVQLTAEPLASLVDSAYLGRLGPAVLGGAGVAISAHYALAKLYNDPLLRTSISLVAQEDAAQEDAAQEDAPSSPASSSTSASISTALSLAFLVGAFQAVFYLLLLSPILTSMGVPPASPMRPAASSYLFYRALGSPAATLWLVTNGVFRGLGDTRTPLLYSLLFTALNALLDPLLIFPGGMGAGGAALGTALAQYAALLPLLLALHKRVPLRNLLRTASSRSLLRSSVSAYLSAGSAVLLRTFGKVSCYAYAGRAAALLGPVAAAAYNLTFQLGFATTQVCESVAVAVQTLLARDFGRSPSAPPNARALVKLSVLAGGSVSLLLSLLTYLLRDSLLPLISRDAGVVAAASGIFPVVLVAQVLKGLAYPCNGIIMGGLDWSFSMLAMWLSNAACLSYFKYAERLSPGAGALLSLGQIWTGLSIFMGGQVLLSAARVASKTGPWTALKEKQKIDAL